MKIFITGGTGLIGQALVAKWLEQQHQVVLLARSPEKIQSIFAPHFCSISSSSDFSTSNASLSAVNSLQVFSDFNDFDAVVNLAGEPIFDRYWSKVQKAKLWHSRVDLTEKLTALINASHTPPRCFISGSASGYYGDHGDELIDENTPASKNFAAQLCTAWEAAAKPAKSRVCLVRTGMVFAPQGGALGKMLPLYRWGLGGKLGNGKQFMPWIALQDMVNGIDFLLHNDNAQGAFNFCAPHSVRNAQFNQLFAKQLKRPHWATAPAFALKMVLGERAHLLLDSQNMRPQKLLDLGFSFQYPQLEDYFSATFGKAEINV
ncbi:epimerase [Pasteurellaceae bacterium Pebbles2]|nr:epimerase [Pasteurellaceae bacterium Pebbles2]